MVVPVFNEERALEELIARCLRASREAAASFELVLVDDGSTDGTPHLLAAHATNPNVRPVRLEPNAGQFRATLHGLQRATGDLIVVLDGDLQDPPEEIPRLVQALRGAPADVTVAYAVKADRDDPPWLRLGAALYHLLQTGLGRGAVPTGAGSYCVMRRAVAGRVASLTVRRANLAAALAAVGVVAITVPYRKQGRYDGRSRVGFVGLVREALGSLALTGALWRLLGLVALLTAIALWQLCRRSAP